MKNLFMKKALLTVGAVSVVGVIGALIWTSIPRDIPKPPVPERKVVEGSAMTDYGEYSHSKSFKRAKGARAWVRMKITDINPGKFYWTLSGEEEEMPGLYPENIKEDGKGKYTEGKSCSFELLDTIYGDEIKRDKTFYISNKLEDVAIGHEVIAVIEELGEDSMIEGADYSRTTVLFFVDENNKIQTASSSESSFLYEKYEGMDVDDFINDIKKEMNEEE